MRPFGGGKGVEVAVGGGVGVGLDRGGGSGGVEGFGMWKGCWGVYVV